MPVAGRLLLANPGRLIVLVAGAISVALATSGIVLAASTSLAIVRQTVDSGWRGTYDLLIRPADAPALSIDGRKVVPLDYLGLRSSGITREQWQRIAGLADVDVAAPVAALGWFKNSSPSVQVEIPDFKPGVVYRVEVKVQIAGQAAVLANGIFAAVPDQAPLSIAIQDAYVTGNVGHVSPLLGTLPATWGLIVGVDPTEEDKLIGLSGDVDGTFLTTGISQTSDPVFRRNAVAIPILTATRSPLPGELGVSVFALDGLTPEAATTAWTGESPRSLTEFEAAVEKIIEMGSSRRVTADSATLADLVRPLRATGVTLTADGQLRADDEEALLSAVDNNIVLEPSLKAYDPSTDPKDDLELRSLGTWQQLIEPRLNAARPPGWFPPAATYGGDSDVYRDVSVSVPPAFVLTPIGTYDRDAIAGRFASAANYAPLGIYDSIPRTLVKDADGNPVDEPLPVSINPAGLNPQPPIGLTNLEAVEALRGDHFIDAIRVRVGGITGYTPDAVRRIETVAQQIVETTGLHVDVIAGSSPVDLRVAVPGVGVMTERWTTLGTAAAIVSGAEGLSAGLLGAALLVIVAYLAAFGVFLTGDQATELGILRRVGWRRRALVELVAMQALALGLVAAALTVGLVVTLAAAGGQRVDGGALAVAALVVLAAHPAAAGIAGAASLGRRGASSGARALRPARSRGGPVGLAMALASERPGRAVVAGVATALALSVAGIVAAIELAAGGELRTTLFGQVVAVRLASYHLLAAAAALFAAGALVLDGALLTVERRLSLIGTLRAVGWRSGAIRLLVTLETGLPAIAAGLAAAGLVGAVAAALGLGVVILPLALGVLALAVVLAVAATQPPAGVAVRTAPAATLRAEGASGIVGGFAPRQALLTVTALVLVVGLVAGGWGAAEGAASKPLPFVAPTEHPLSAVAQQIQADVAAIVAEPDRTPGSESFEHALAYLGDALTSTGYTVATSAYLSPQPEYFGADGKPVTLPGVFSPALAYDAATWNGEGVDLEVTFADATDGRLPKACPAGVAILRIADYPQVPLAQQLQQRCLQRTAAVLAVHSADDDAWLAMTGQVTRVRLPVAHFLTATSPALAPGASAPWLVTSLDSRGPGASQSAAPAAVLLAVARQAKTEGLALRIGLVGATDQAAGSVFLQHVASEPSGPMVWLGPMGASVAPVLGTAVISGADAAAATAGLLWIARVDGSFAGWLSQATDPSDAPTSRDLLDVLSAATATAAGDEANLNLGPLTAGIDAAWLGEPSVVTVGPPSIAGTPADTVDQVHPRGLEQLANALVAALGDLER